MCIYVDTKIVTLHFKTMHTLIRLLYLVGGGYVGPHARAASRSLCHLSTTTPTESLFAVSRVRFKGAAISSSRPSLVWPVVSLPCGRDALDLADATDSVGSGRGCRNTHAGRAMALAPRCSDLILRCNPDRKGTYRCISTLYKLGLTSGHDFAPRFCSGPF